VVGAGWRADRVDVQARGEPGAPDDGIARRGEGAQHVGGAHDVLDRGHGFDREPQVGDGLAVARHGGRRAGPDHDGVDGADRGDRAGVLDGERARADQPEYGAAGAGQVGGGDRARRGGAYGRDPAAVDQGLALSGLGRDDHDR
jgi:hypothetical protein